MAEDKRIRHSKERISRAMIACLNNTSLDKITVRQICDTADVNRSTFYAHYPNPITLYRQLEQSMADSFDRHFEVLKSKTISYEDFLRSFLEYCAENSELFLALYKTDSASFKKRVLDLAGNYDFLTSHYSEKEKSYIFDFYINGVFSMVARWLRDDHAKSIDEMARLIYPLTHRPANNGI